ncbi:TadE family type IV pilus minor pilin [Herbiconiux sp. P18]|uniref:TadE family type IV pilus minor pilin n=1 Tax=Herbiconiux liangxiaofengii TaxID=3342795 RepID=UPI0035B9A7F3
MPSRRRVDLWFLPGRVPGQGRSTPDRQEFGALSSPEESWRGRVRRDDGSVTAEFAVLLPAVAMVLVLGLGLLQLGTVQVRLTDAAADAARLVARGQDAGARVAAAHPGATSATAHLGPLVCVTVSALASPTGVGAAFALEGRGCALDDTATPPP